ncbi:MAG TPA: hypothetical protein VGC80_01670 [Acetobacteraceae bacterium]
MARSSRPIKRLPAPALAFATLLGAAACAPASPTAARADADAGRAAGVSPAVIVSMRPIPARALYTPVAAAMGGLTLVESQTGRGTVTEFIIREEGGQTLSVVQGNEEGFRPGERVTLTRGARTRIARATN